MILFASKLQTRKHCDDLVWKPTRRLLARSASPGTDPQALPADCRRWRRTCCAGAPGGRPWAWSSVRFCGFRNQSELPRFFDLATVFVLPSQPRTLGPHCQRGDERRPSRSSSPMTVGCAARSGQRRQSKDAIVPVRNVDALTAALRPGTRCPRHGPGDGTSAHVDRINHWSFEEDVAGPAGSSWRTAHAQDLRMTDQEFSTPMRVPAITPQIASGALEGALIGRRTHARR